MLENGDNSTRINQMIADGRIVRNDEVVGSIPTSSTKVLPRGPSLRSGFRLQAPPPFARDHARKTATLRMTPLQDARCPIFTLSHYPALQVPFIFKV